MAAIIRDLRERKAAERRYAELFESASDGIFIADPSGVIEEVNVAGCRLLGRRRGEVVGRSIREFIPPEDATRLVAAREALLDGEAQVGDWQLVAADGARVPVEASAAIRGGRWRCSSATSGPARPPRRPWRASTTRRRWPRRGCRACSTACPRRCCWSTPTATCRTTRPRSGSSPPATARRASTCASLTGPRSGGPSCR
ncbi:PAS domain S-box protein [Nannocystis pusilla]|uniref:PAS domain S-box protein n=1 Tax=Nannocystis pusilla TaxID=889268 RepID=A0A9X3EZV0_9BACT|nr:PAS domain S-box protein [Nannocystis pusilla]MCY1012635.1 PAS domain S-box protein [Nannocystis pusilla]